MEREELTIAIDNQETSDKLKNIFLEAGYRVLHQCNSGNELLRTLSINTPDIIISGFKLKDMTLYNLVEMVGGRVDILAIIPPYQMEMISEDLDIYTIELPISKSILINTLKIIFQSKKKTTKLIDKIRKLELTIEERKVIEKAKGIVMREKGFSEEEAFRYIQKQSMNLCLKMVDTSKEIINGELKGGI